MCTQNVDCQNRFSMDANKGEMPSSNTSNYNSSQTDYGASTRGNRKLFENDAYEKYSKSLFSTAKSCDQAGIIAKDTQRKLLNTFCEKLLEIKEDLDKK